MDVGPDFFKNVNFCGIQEETGGTMSLRYPLK